jgi:hypothetical protein
MKNGESGLIKTILCPDFDALSLEFLTFKIARLPLGM